MQMARQQDELLGFNPTLHSIMETGVPWIDFFDAYALGSDVENAAVMTKVSVIND